MDASKSITAAFAAAALAAGIGGTAAAKPRVRPYVIPAVATPSPGGEGGAVPGEGGAPGQPGGGCGGSGGNSGTDGAVAGGPFSKCPIHSDRAIKTDVLAVAWD
jgi:hypothetical protein